MGHDVAPDVGQLEQRTEVAFVAPLVDREQDRAAAPDQEQEPVSLNVDRTRRPPLLERTGAREIHDRLVGRTRILGKKERSEEHTSELQSRSDLVCRLLLEKKNNTQQPY